MPCEAAAPLPAGLKLVHREKAQQHNGGVGLRQDVWLSLSRRAQRCHAAAALQQNTQTCCISASAVRGGDGAGGIHPRWMALSISGGSRMVLEDLPKGPSRRLATPLPHSGVGGLPSPGARGRV